MKFKLDRKVFADLLDIVVWYEEQSVGTGSRFIESVFTAVGRAAQFPNSGAPHLDGTRRIVLDRFPYSLVYRVGRTEIRVVVIESARREPGYWLDR